MCLLKTESPICFLFIFCFIVLIDPDPLKAQRSVTTEAGASLRIYSPEDGIPSHSPTNAFVTNNGYLWLSTTGGTVRISGNEIEDFGAEHGINLMQQMYYDRDRDVIWFTDSETLARFDGEKITRFNADDGFSPPGGARKEVQPMLADSKGRLWIGSSTPPFNTPYNGGLLLYENNQFKQFSREKFPLHNVSGIYESSDGSIWFTSSGYLADGFNNNESWVARFIDDEFELFDGSDDCLNVAGAFREPEGNSISIIEDGDGNTWFRCLGKYNASADQLLQNGVFRFDGNSFTPAIEVNERISSSSQLSDIVFNENQNELYVTFINNNGYTPEELAGSVMVYRNGRWQTEMIIQPEQVEQTIANHFDTDVIILGFFLVKSGDDEILANLRVVDSGRLVTILYSNEGGQWHWIDILEGFALMNLIGDVYLTAQDEPDVFGIYTPPYSSLLTEDDGLLKLPAESIRGNYYKERFFKDSEENIWITYLNQWDSETQTWDGLGTSMWDGEQIHNFSVDDGFSSNNLFYINQTSDGSLWFPSDNGMNRMTRNETGFQISAIFDANQQPFWSVKVVERTNGEIFTYMNYVAPESELQPESTFFLARFNGNSFDPFDSPFPDSLMALPYHEYEMNPGNDNRLWLNARFATSTSGLLTAASHIRIFEDDTWVKPPDEWNTPDTRLFYVGELDNARYFVINGGFIKFDYDKDRFINLSDSTNVNADFRILRRVNTSGMFFNIEGDDHLYIRFRDMGIAVFDGTNLTYLDRRNGLPSLRISYPHKDRNGDMLFTTPTGGIIFNGTDFTAIRNDAVTGGSERAIARDKFNNILIQHEGLGISVTRMDTTRYPVRLASIRSDTIRFYEGQSVRLNSNQNNIEFRFNTLNFTNPDDVQFSYMLDGLDQEWSRPTKANFREYRSLPSGEYTFRVRSVGPGTVISEESSFSFTIDPPWWRSWWAFGMYVLIFAGGVFATDRIQRRRLMIQEQERTRKRELEQAKQIEKAYHELEKAHENLKSAQDQLIQQEKLASLGQLTAGIAHEIKNPLNFVNNFSEVSLELVEEAREEIRQRTDDQGPERKNSPFEGESERSEQGDERPQNIALPQNFDTDPNSVNTPLNPLSREDNGSSQNLDLILEILDDIEANLKKIHEHGSRADSIVKSMLMHSRGGSGKMEPADLNGIIKEYVNLAFHGMRAGKNPISVDIDLQLDKSIGEVSLIAEDFSRVVLNLCNNAFDAMREKANVKRETADSPFEGGSERSEQGDDSSLNYHPKLTVRTHQTEKTVTIEIEDNGPGISDEIKEKILQPFFTTKKGTEGTGLGLSITHDIVKAHRGDLQLNSVPGKKTVFQIRLPL